MTKICWKFWSGEQHYSLRQCETAQLDPLEEEFKFIFSSEENYFTCIIWLWSRLQEYTAVKT